MEVESEIGNVELFVHQQLNDLLDFGTTGFCVEDTKRHSKMSEHRRDGKTSIDKGSVSRAWRLWSVVTVPTVATARPIFLHNLRYLGIGMKIIHRAKLVHKLEENPS